MLDKSILVKLLGFRGNFIHGDTLITDRWLWLKKRLPKTKNGETLIDIGCGTGAFSMGAALRGYDALGLSWDERNQRVAEDRAKICKADKAKFEVLDARNLASREDLIGQFDVAVCFETIEHIINDRKLLIDIAQCLKPGGRLLLTTPSFIFRPITSGDKGPFSKVEDGGHVRRGYTKAMLEELCGQANLLIDDISYCSGFLSQKITFIQRVVSKMHPLFGWATILPLRFLPLLFDRFVTSLLRWPYFSICLEAYKPRYSNGALSGR
jgi:2-polyprenyl-3-methyl-5-hydroxy-6-metoxy-1,4-benzoquinol methylase